MTLVVFENNSTEYIPVSRYPIVKVQRINRNSWGNYVVYNSNNVQQDPDIEGSKTTLSYIINYSIGGGQFKKVANVQDRHGYFCQPSIFTGTDSKLITNSYTGDYGTNLSLLTLSPQSSLYKLDKQNFIITNIANGDAFNVDNIDGVVNLDTIKYSFKLGPIFIQDNAGGIVGGTFGEGADDPSLTGIQFNENLKSKPFLLSNGQALLIGANAIYIKDNGYYSISNIPYAVNLINKTTGVLRRMLFRDTVKAVDSIETEYLRGFYIDSIPNGSDSFYVKLVINNSFADANYYINPIYYDPNGANGENVPERKMAVVFENSNTHNVAKNIPTEYGLLQNYPNPFNPTTTIQYNLPVEGLVKIKVYDISGREIMNLVNDFKNAGSYSINFDGTNFSSGVYYYRIESGKFQQTKRMVLIK